MSIFIEQHRKVFIIALVIVLITFSFFMLLLEEKESDVLNGAALESNSVTVEVESGNHGD